MATSNSFVSGLEWRGWWSISVPLFSRIGAYARYRNGIDAEAGSACIRRHGSVEQASQSASRHTETDRHAYKQASVRSNQASERPVVCCCTAASVTRYKARQCRPTLRMHAYTAASQPASHSRPSPCIVQSSSGVTFYNGNSRPYSALHLFSNAEYFVSAGFGDEKLSPGFTPTRTWKKESRSSQIRRRRRLRVECVRACVRAGVAAKIYRKANCTPSTAARGSARDVSAAMPAALFNRSLFPTLLSD